MAKDSKQNGKSQQTLFSFFNKSTPQTAPKSTPKPIVTKPETTRDKVNQVKRTPDKKLSTSISNDSIEMDIDDTTESNKGLENAADNNRRRRKRVNYTEIENDSESESSDQTNDVGKRRKRLVKRIDMSDSEDEFKPDKSINNKDDDDDIEFDDIEGLEDLLDDDILNKPNKKLQNTKPKEEPLTPIQERFKKFSMNSSSPAPKSITSNFLTTTKQEKQQGRNKSFKEKNDERYSWLANMKDANGNAPDSPDYDPRTLYIPNSAWQKFTPFEKQFWEIKSKHWDCVVFFKKGKFYELYEKDADIGHQTFDLKLTDRVNMRMVGVPEKSFDFWASQFVAKGYKVARVDQLETAIGKTLRERNDADGKADKVIRRELTAVLTAGTLVDAGLLTDDMSTYCMAIKEYCPTENSHPVFGISFVDTAMAEFNLVTFTDDKSRTVFETLIMQIKPRELIIEKGHLSPASTRILKNSINDPIWNMLDPDTEFWNERVTEDEIRIGGYFSEEDTDMGLNESWPPALQEATKTPILMSSLGGLIWYLRSLKLDKELLSARNIRKYDPLQNATSLLLDGQTLANLEILQNSHDGSNEGTVFKLLANSITPFGKRLFKYWLCRPLCKISDIRNRQDAVEDLMNLDEVFDRLSNEFVGLPDLERLISRVHSKRCKVSEFLTVLDGFNKVNELIEWLKSISSVFNSTLLKTLVENFPALSEHLNYFREAFIVKEMEIDYQSMSVIIPKDGVNEDWDSINNEIKEMEKNFNDHLTKMKRELKCARIDYKHMGKEIYQIEVPKDIKVPNNWTTMSSTSKVNRYWNPTLRQLIPEYKEQLEVKNAFTKNFATEVYGEFDKFYVKWLEAVKTISHLDALLGLAKGSASLGEPACRPEFVDQETSLLEFEELRHPCVIPSAATDFIPNDTVLGGEGQSNIIVLTGPNMGGKSTLLRQTCVAIIMAQLGGYVPAKSCRMTAVDRIYTRIGANDNILAGQSTFMVELDETSKILHEATPRSMVILDELGRGTSTFDGYAIAYSVLHYLARYTGCLVMFSTHYHTLCKEFDRYPSIRNMHM
ncbi:muts domain V-domain-containing protein [Cunninghamella echinulata]|nr:muts domain V-domain-containing protein [Cunninghamella echinulata]